jgi:hypothetical protein
VPVQDACERPVSSLDSQIAELKSRRRSPIEFDEWKPSPFYYLYAPVGALLVYFLTGPEWWGLGKLTATGLCFGSSVIFPSSTTAFASGCLSVGRTDACTEGSHR